jgi:hypothetical protein
MLLRNFLVGLSRLSPVTTGVKYYALDLVGYLERAMACRILAAAHLAPRSKTRSYVAIPFAYGTALQQEGG